MAKPMGRSDDMLIIRGVNVFPSQIEEVLLKVSGENITPNYQIIVGRENNTDTLDINCLLYTSNPNRPTHPRMDCFIAFPNPSRIS